MKITTYFNLLAILFLLSYQTGFCQDDPLNQPSAFDWLDEPISKNPTVGGSPFNQGNWNFHLRNSVKYQSFKQDEYTDNDLGVNLMVRYFVANGFAVGVDLGYDNETSEGSGYTQKSSGYDVMGGLAYGHSFGNFNLLLEGWAGIGKVKDDYTGSSSEQITDRFKYKVALASPIRAGGRPVTFTPRVGFSSLKETDPEFSDYEETTSGLFFDVKVDFYLGCEDMFCGYKGAGDDFGGWNRQGSNQLVVPSWMRFKTGQQIQKYTGDFGSEMKESYTNFKFAIADYQYLVDNLAIGLEASVQNQVNKPEDSDYKYSTFMYSLMPMVRGNLPVEGGLNNLFLEGGYGIGSSKSKQESGGTTSESTWNVSAYKVGLGFNVFLHYNLGLTFSVNYNGVTIKDDNDNKQESTGIVGAIGTTFAF